MALSVHQIPNEVLRKKEGIKFREGEASSKTVAFNKKTGKLPSCNLGPTAGRNVDK